MTMKRMLVGAAVVAALQCSTPLAQASPMATVAFSPVGGNLQGMGGETRSLTYTITNTSDAGEWLLVTGLAVNEVVTLPGTWVETFDYPVAAFAPGATITGPVLDFTFDTGLPFGTAGFGTVDFTFETLSAVGGPPPDTFDAGAEFSATVPEPLTFVLVLVGGGAAVRRRRSR